MITIGELFPPDAANDYGQVGWSDEKKIEMQKRIVGAYAAVFSGRGSKDDADLVLVDLARFTRYLDTAPLDAPADVVKALDQRRAVFARIVEAVIQAGGNVDGLHRAVLATPSTDAEEA